MCAMSAVGHRHAGTKGRVCLVHCGCWAEPVHAKRYRQCQHVLLCQMVVAASDVPSVSAADVHMANKAPNKEEEGRRGLTFTIWPAVSEKVRPLDAVSACAAEICLTWPQQNRAASNRPSPQLQKGCSRWGCTTRGSSKGVFTIEGQ